jgi:hypothetical protein
MKGHVPLRQSKLTHVLKNTLGGTAILIVIEGQFHAFQRFSSSKLVLKTVESRLAALNYYENGSNYKRHLRTI